MQLNRQPLIVCVLGDRYGDGTTTLRRDFPRRGPVS